MSLGRCWDCPVPILRALIQVAISVLFLGVAVRLGSARSIALRGIGVFGTAFALLLYLIFGVGIVKFGVAWSENAFPSQVAQYLVVGLWFASTVLVIFKLQQSHRRRRIQPAAGV